MEKTYQYAMNNLVSSPESVLSLSRSVALAIKNGLMGNGVSFTDQSGSVVPSPTGTWTMYYSCDGTTSGTANDGVDRIGTDPTKLVRAAAGVAHSWFVLKSPTMSTPTFSPGAPFYLIFDVAGSTDQVFWTVWGSKSAPTGGTTTARPTATDEWQFSNTATYLNDNTASDCRTNMVLCTDGSFLFFTTKVGTGYVNYAMTFLLLADSLASDGYPLFTMNTYSTHANGALSPYYLSIYFANSTAFSARGRIHDGTAISTHAVLIPLVGNAASGWYTFWDGGFVTSIGDIQTGNSPMFVAWVYSISTGYYHYRGRLKDVFTGVTNNSPEAGYAYPPNARPQLVNLGGTWVPTNTGIMWG